MHPHTLMAQAGARRDPGTGAISMPLYFSAAFQHPALGQSTGFDYSRTANPTRQVLEQTMAALEGGARGLAFSSGLAALDAVLRLFAPGDALVVTEDLYGGSFRLFENFYREQGISFLYTDTSDSAAVARALDSPGVKGLFLELPTNPLLKVADLSALADLIRNRNILFLVDNTFLTPALCRPFDYGADVTLYSATKYLSGHHDCLAGLAVTRDAGLGERLAFIQNATGAVLGPFESWLLLRSLKTLPLRLARHGENALRVASFLEKHPKIRNLRYPGLPSDPGYRTLARQASGFGGMISCEVASPAEVQRILASLGVFLFAESLGGAESLITYPLVQTHADIAPETLERLGVTDCLLRLSIGLEDPEDLIADLRAVLG
ncbi:MAG: PLP-dependent aspartate aminotransferase family protein [Desulfovibrio sp.]|jgi:cystathionine gamma-synthase/cystathionine beta-lyase|nr:PLP-dependent aspartate aminotransferase family protein [Desulfovibrio sp.]